MTTDHRVRLLFCCHNQNFTRPTTVRAASRCDDVLLALAVLFISISISYLLSQLTPFLALNVQPLFQNPVRPPSKAIRSRTPLNSICLICTRWPCCRRIWGVARWQCWVMGREQSLRLNTIAYSSLHGMYLQFNYTLSDIASF